MKFTKRKDGRYQTKVYIGMIDGKKKFKYIYASNQKELSRLYAEAKIKASKGIDVTRYDNSLLLWISEYLTSREGKIRDSELQTEKHRLTYFSDRIGQLKLKDVNTEIVQCIIDELAVCNPTTNKPTSKKTLEGYLACLGRVFKYAQQKRVTDFNPCLYVTLPKDAPKSERWYLSDEEIEWILDTPHEMQLPSLISIFCGLRRGELSALLWSDVNLATDMISVTKSYSYKTNETKSTKTRSGVRTVPIPEVLHDYLVAHQSEGLVVQHNGKRMTEASWRRCWNSYLAELERKYGSYGEDYDNKKLNKDSLPVLSFDRFTFHFLRHTYATLLYKADVPITDAKFLLGHSDIKMTANIYTHLDEEKQKKSIVKLNKWVSEKLS